MPLLSLLSHFLKRLYYTTASNDVNKHLPDGLTRTVTLRGNYRETGKKAEDRTNPDRLPSVSFPG
jgi:hypothetical protein